MVVWFPWVSRDKPSFLAPTLSHGRPPPHQKISGLKSLGLGSFFVPALFTARTRVLTPLPLGPKSPKSPKKVLTGFPARKLRKSAKGPDKESKKRQNQWSGTFSTFFWHSGPGGPFCEVWGFRGSGVWRLLFMGIAIVTLGRTPKRSYSPRGRSRDLLETPF